MVILLLWGLTFLLLVVSRGDAPSYVWVVWLGQPITALMFFWAGAVIHRLDTIAWAVLHK
jgi:hypothetical protein